MVEMTKSVVGSLSSEVAVRDAYVLCLRIGPRFTSKSEYPSTLFGQVGWEEIGSKRWHTISRVPNDDSADSSTEDESRDSEQQRQLTAGKTVFVRSSLANLDLLERRLHQSLSSLTNSWQNDVRKVERLDLQAEDEALLGFSEHWRNGAADIILHPFGRYTDAAQGLVLGQLARRGIATDSIRVYESVSGLTYVNALLTRESFTTFATLNPVRAIIPLSAIALPTMRAVGQADGPLPPATEQGLRPKYSVGMFDGGVDETNPFLQEYVIHSDELSPNPPREGVGLAS